MEAIVNKVAQSGLIVLDMKSFVPSDDDVVIFDLKPFLFQELLLREKDFRASMKSLDWSQYQDKYVAITCSSDAIVPMWAYMLIASNLEGIAKDFIFGDKNQMNQHVLIQHIQNIDREAYKDVKLVIKGCGDVSVYEGAYLAITKHLKPVVKSLMFGEPCSTVPIYKQSK
jgi:hypothetical protein